MKKVDYDQACEELLKDDEYYKEEKTDRSKEFSKEIKGNIEEMNDLLTKKEKVSPRRCRQSSPNTSLLWTAQDTL